MMLNWISAIGLIQLPSCAHWLPSDDYAFIFYQDSYEDGSDEKPVNWSNLRMHEQL